MSMAKDPQTPQEWQQAVDAAEAWIVFDSAKEYGLITGGPKIDVARCKELLARGKRLGIYPEGRVLQLVTELKEQGLIKY